MAQKRKCNSLVIQNLFLDIFENKLCGANGKHIILQLTIAASTKIKDYCKTCDYFSNLLSLRLQEFINPGVYVQESIFIPSHSNDPIRLKLGKRFQRKPGMVVDCM